jgi:hypothetical protein
MLISKTEVLQYTHPLGWKLVLLNQRLQNPQSCTKWLMTGYELVGQKTNLL